MATRRGVRAGRSVPKAQALKQRIPSPHEATGPEEEIMGRRKITVEAWLGGGIISLKWRRLGQAGPPAAGVTHKLSHNIVNIGTVLGKAFPNTFLFLYNWRG